MSVLRRCIPNLQPVGFDQRRRRQAVPIGHRLVVFCGFVVPAMFQVNDCLLSEGHQVGEQKAIGGLDLVFFVYGKLCAACAHRMADEGQGHVQTAPIVPTAAPLFGARTLRLRRKAVIEEEPRIAF